MAYTSAQLATVRAAIASGVQSGRTADKQITWRSLDELIRIEEKISASVNSDSTPRTSYATFSKD